MLASAVANELSRPSMPLAEEKRELHLKDLQWPSSATFYEPEPKTLVLKIEYADAGDWGVPIKQSLQQRAQPNQPWFARYRKPEKRNRRR